VTDIVVVDGHGSGNVLEPDVLEAKLLPPAKMISRGAAFDIYMDSYDHSIDAIVAVAMHAGAGNGAGFLSHTYSGVELEYRVNGVPFNETMILAAGAARLKIPDMFQDGGDGLGNIIIRRRHSGLGIKEVEIHPRHGGTDHARQVRAEVFVDAATTVFV